jgi:hypothetical protein
VRQRGVERPACNASGDASNERGEGLDAHRGATASDAW